MYIYIYIYIYIPAEFWQSVLTHRKPIQQAITQPSNMWGKRLTQYRVAQEASASLIWFG